MRHLRELHLLAPRYVPERKHNQHETQYEHSLSNDYRLVGDFQGREIYITMGMIFMLAVVQLFQGGEGLAVVPSLFTR